MKIESETQWLARSISDHNALKAEMAPLLPGLTPDHVADIAVVVARDNHDLAHEVVQLIAAGERKRVGIRLTAVNPRSTCCVLWRDRRAACRKNRTAVACLPIYRDPQ